MSDPDVRTATMTVTILDILGTEGDWPRLARYILTEITAARREALEEAAQVAPQSGDFGWVAARIRELKEEP